MAFYMYVYLLVVFLILCLALLWHLCWFPRRPSSSSGRAKRSTLHRLLKPRTPRDCPACCLSSSVSYWLVFRLLELESPALPDRLLASDEM